MVSAVNAINKNSECLTMPTVNVNAWKDTLIMEMSCVSLAITLASSVNLLPHANPATKIISESLMEVTAFVWKDTMMMEPILCVFPATITVRLALLKVFAVPVNEPIIGNWTPQQTSACA